MACCADTGCGDPACRLCTVVAHLVIQQCTRDTADGAACRLVAGHPGDHVAVTRAGKVEKAELREAKAS